MIIGKGQTERKAGMNRIRTRKKKIRVGVGTDKG